jgi:hypothetical protein
MAKKAKAAKSASSDVESYKRKEAKRKNIPTAENQKLIAATIRRSKNFGGRAILILPAACMAWARTPTRSAGRRTHRRFSAYLNCGRSNVTSKSAARYPANAVKTPIFANQLVATPTLPNKGCITASFMAAIIRITIKPLNGNRPDSRNGTQKIRNISL